VTVNFPNTGSANAGTVFIDVVQLASGLDIGNSGTNSANSKTAVASVTVGTATDGEVAFIGVDSSRTFSTPPNATFTTLATIQPTNNLFGSFWTRPVQPSANFGLSSTGAAPNWGSIAIEVG
jgi:hypothetical protein